ncbi:MAG: rhombosortase [Candidatus Thiodiazotropha sp. (ex Notomyrtea botanica)]|nr:rhombosortase [Candidatus Thiodiazotropha sp. (ex Notomyrtea botanica)]
MKGLLSNSYHCPLAITAVCIILGLLPERFQDLLQYELSAIQTGEWWRLVTGHFVHLGWEHTVMNLAGLWLISHLFLSAEMRMKSWCYWLPALALGTSAGLLLWSPEVAWYRGLSGVLHGVLVYLLLRQVWRQPRWSVLGLLLIAGKLTWEQLTGPLPGSESWVDGRVIVDAHLYGGIGGVLLWGIECSYLRLIRQEVTG